MIIILDIDETLIHSVKNNDVLPGTDTKDTFQVFKYTVFKRPHLDLFLNRLLNDPYYQIGIWSAGSYEYVHAIVDRIISPKDKHKLKFVLTADDCNEDRNKPLYKVRDLCNQIGDNKGIPWTIHDFLIVDDKPYVTEHDELNHLQIREYEGEADDVELLYLLKYLMHNRYQSSEYLAVNWK